MPRPQGYLCITDPDAPLIERDTITCAHCQRMVEIKPNTGGTVYLVYDRSLRQYREAPGAFCRLCMAPICLGCHATGTCVPIERWLEAQESRDRLYRAVTGG